VGPLIQEMTPPAVISSCQPEYRIRHEPPEAEFPEYLLAEFFMKSLVCRRARLTLQIAKLVKSTTVKDRWKIVMVCYFVFLSL
jgi:hypothetical protein